MDEPAPQKEPPAKKWCSGLRAWRSPDVLALGAGIGHVPQTLLSAWVKASQQAGSVSVFPSAPPSSYPWDSQAVCSELLEGRDLVLVDPPVPRAYAEAEVAQSSLPPCHHHGQVVLSPTLCSPTNLILLLGSKWKANSAKANVKKASRQHSIPLTSVQF